MTKLGTPYYVSPEVLEGIYDKRCDLWAVGVLTFILICGTPPFNGKDEVEVFHKISCCDYDFPENDWKDKSEESQDFIEKLLNPNPQKRMCSAEALAHPWLKIAEDTKNVSEDVMSRLRLF